MGQLENLKNKKHNFKLFKLFYTHLRILKNKNQVNFCRWDDEGI